MAYMGVGSPHLKAEGDWPPLCAKCGDRARNASRISKQSKGINRHLSRNLNSELAKFNFKKNPLSLTILNKAFLASYVKEGVFEKHEILYKMCILNQSEKV